MSTDAIVMLRDDHKKIRKLIHTYRADSEQVLSSAGDGPQETVTPGEIVRELLHELTVHTFVEDEVMYPQVRQLVPETGSLVLEFHEEHHVANVLAAELERMKQDDEVLRCQGPGPDGCRRTAHGCRREGMVPPGA
ncbi:hemerythrin domain-containing protein [Streptomyces sp. NPDC002467]|uniref:hemerythrin domain-containing protein n=1 Tax=Streptomyces sp. NPDC002467 TaxID=3364647 RepID=UPI0036991FC6